MKILITGGAGYLGSILTHYLIWAGHKVTVLDNFMYSQTPLSYICDADALTIIDGDCRSESDLIDAGLREADVIIPLAAIVGAPACVKDETAADSTNVGAIQSLDVHTSKQQWIIYPTTNSGYGIGKPGELCTEETPLKPISYYGRQKVRSEYQIMQRENSISLRLATVFGMSPRMRLDLLVNDFVYRAVKDHFVVLFEPHFKRNYIHVRDVARTFDWAIDHFESMKGNIFNVGLSSANLSKLELCASIRERVPNFTYPVAELAEDPDKRDYTVSNAKLEATGWEPAYSLDDGILELIKGYQQYKRPWSNV